jgi:uncharacterized membrane protein
LINDPDTRRRMGQLGRARVLDHLSWTHSTPVLLAAYDRIFAKAGYPVMTDPLLVPLTKPQHE